MDLNQKKTSESFISRNKIGENAEVSQGELSHAGSVLAKGTMEQDCVTLSPLTDAKEMIPWQ